jgi:hypothetical protein
MGSERTRAWRRPGPTAVRSPEEIVCGGNAVGPITFTPDALRIDMQDIHPVAGRSFTTPLTSAVPEPASRAARHPEAASLA